MCPNCNDKICQNKCANGNDCKQCAGDDSTVILETAAFSSQELSHHAICVGECDRLIASVTDDMLADLRKRGLLASQVKRFKVTVKIQGEIIP